VCTFVVGVDEEVSSLPFSSTAQMNEDTDLEISRIFIEMEL
jgi:hypothetical protein